MRQKKDSFKIHFIQEANIHGIRALIQLTKMISSLTKDTVPSSVENIVWFLGKFMFTHSTCVTSSMIESSIAYELSKQDTQMLKRKSDPYTPSNAKIIKSVKQDTTSLIQYVDLFIETVKALVNVPEDFHSRDLASKIFYCISSFSPTISRLKSIEFQEKTILPLILSNPEIQLFTLLGIRNSLLNSPQDFIWAPNVFSAVCSVISSKSEFKENKSAAIDIVTSIPTNELCTFLDSNLLSAFTKTICSLIKYYNPRFTFQIECSKVLLSQVSIKASEELQINTNSNRNLALERLEEQQMVKLISKLTDLVKSKLREKVVALISVENIGNRLMQLLSCQNEGIVQATWKLILSSGEKGTSQTIQSLSTTSRTKFVAHFESFVFKSLQEQPLALENIDFTLLFECNEVKKAITSACVKMICKESPHRKSLVLKFGKSFLTAFIQLVLVDVEFFNEINSLLSISKEEIQFESKKPNFSFNSQLTFLKYEKRDNRKRSCWSCLQSKVQGPESGSEKVQ